MSTFQLPMFWRKFVAKESSPCRFQAAGLSAAFAGTRASRSGGFAEVEDAALGEVPFAGVLPSQELAADLELVAFLVEGEIVPRRQHALLELLGKILRRADCAVDEVQTRRAGTGPSSGPLRLEIRNAKTVRPPERVVTDPQLLDAAVAAYVRPADEKIVRVARTGGGLSRMLGLFVERP